MGSYTYLNLQTRVSDEINDSSNGSVSLAQVKKAIISAIEHYERERTWFNETITTNLTTSDQFSFINAPTDIVFIDKLQITSGTAKYTIERIPYEEWAIRAGTSTSTGQPTQYAYYQDRFWFFPAPNSAYTLTLSYVKRLTTLSADSDNNGWTNFAEPLIRFRAEWDIFAHLLFFMDLAAQAKAAEMDELMAFDTERMQRNTTGRVRAVYL